MQYAIGDTARLRVVFTVELSNTNFDPAGVKLLVKTSFGVEEKYEYLNDLGIVRAAVGHYYFDLPVLLPTRGCSGVYAYRWLGLDADGKVFVAAEATFEVARSRFREPLG